jgi:hypothetical protein
MRRTRLRLAALAAAVALTAGVTTAGHAVPAPAVRYGSALPRFALFGWVGPPADFSTRARYEELAATGFNVTVLAWDDSGTVTQNRHRLDITRGLGLRLLLLDNDLDRVHPDYPGTLAYADTIAARYRNEPGFLGYYLGDEPPASYFPRLGEWFSVMRTRDPAHPCWNALGPRGAFATNDAFRAYLQAYVDATHPAVLCNNQYDFSNVYGDLHKLTENVATMGEVARAEGIPFWGIVNLVEHWIFRHVTDGMLRWQVAQWIAGGATGIGYFTYWTPAPDPDYQWQPAMIEWGTGARAPAYDMVTELNSRLAPIGNTLAGMRWVAAQQSGSVQPGGTRFAPDSVITGILGRSTLGRFVDSTGTPCVFVANSDSASAQDITLTLGTDRLAKRLRDDGSGWDELTLGADHDLWLALGPGDFVLLRLPSSLDPPPRPALLSLGAIPNPGAGGIVLTVEGAHGDVRFEIVDLAGRVIVSRTLPAGNAVLRWTGERDDGRRVPPGLYYARAHDAGTSVTRSIVWLGH